jgi:5-methylcytosine-specific restriction endonuclease McrA
MGWKYTEERLREAVSHSESYAGVLRYLEIVGAGGNHTHISRSIKRLGIDTSHFTGQAWRKGRTSERRKPPADLLVLGAAGSARVNGERLRKALIEVGVPYVCARCGNTGSWLFEALTLHVDHINGRYWDNRPENLRFLCPNCHAVTPTYAGKNRKSRRLVRLQQQDELAVPSGSRSQLNPAR